LQSQALSDHLVELAKINPSFRVLDIATGIGEPAITVAKKILNDNGDGYVLDTLQILVFSKSACF
jgi:ubiquinone/menaquinone biosynthesis C-methylase UbiE